MNDNSHSHSKSICTSKYICMQRFKIIIIIIVYLFTSSDKTIHRDLELLTSTSYTAVGSGFGPQGVPAEKPRNLLTHHHRECGFAGTVAGTVAAV